MAPKPLILTVIQTPTRPSVMAQISFRKCPKLRPLFTFWNRRLPVCDRINSRVRTAP